MTPLFVLTAHPPISPIGMPFLPFLAFLQVRGEAMIETCFNMGPGNLAKFRLMLACLAGEDFEGAADQAIASRWAD